MTIPGLLHLRVMTAGSLSVCVCVREQKDKGTCLLRFIATVPSTLIASLNPSSACRAHLPVFGADFARLSRTDGVNWHGEYPIATLVRVNAHLKQSKHNKWITFNVTTGNLLVRQTFSQSANQPAS